MIDLDDPKCLRCHVSMDREETAYSDRTFKCPKCEGRITNQIYVSKRYIYQGHVVVPVILRSTFDTRAVIQLQDQRFKIIKQTQLFLSKNDCYDAIICNLNNQLATTSLLLGQVMELKRQDNVRLSRPY